MIRGNDLTLVHGRGEYTPEKIVALRVRVPFLLCTTMTAPAASTTAVQSAEGSACPRLPPIGPDPAAAMEAAAKAAAEGVTILGDRFASEKYRKHLAKVYLKRARMALT